MDARPPLPHLIVSPLQDQVETDGGCGDDENDGAGSVPWGGEGEDVETDNGHGSLVVGTLPTTRQQAMAAIIHKMFLHQLDNVHGTPSNERVVTWSEHLSRLSVRAEEVKKTVAMSPRGRSARTPRRGGKGQPSHQKTQPPPSTTTMSIKAVTQDLRRQVCDVIYQHPEYGDLHPAAREALWDVEHSEHPSSRVDMRRYDVRMATFQEHPLHWRLRTPSAEQLARVGLYYLGVEDRVKCFSCGVELEEWGEEGTPEPLMRHYLARPHCSFLQQDFPEQLATLRDQSTTRHSQNYANTSLRLHSFAQWPYSSVVTSYQLASVGFYYTGEGAKVICFSCGLEVREWKRGDVPLLVHCRTNPDCPFIKSIIKGPPASAQAPTPVLKTLTVDSAAKPNFTDIQVRLKSFKKLSPAFPIPRQELAEAGLFLLRLPDVMKCHSCHCVVQGWVEGDVAVEKHRRASRDCPFLTNRFPSKMDSTQDFDPSDLPAPQFDESELEMMAKQQSVPPTSHLTPTPSLSHTFTPSLPPPVATPHPASLPFEGLFISSPHTLPSSHHSHSPTSTHHTSLTDSQPPSLTEASLASPQPLSLSAALTQHPPSSSSLQASSGYHSTAQRSTLYSATPFTGSLSSHFNSENQPSRYQSSYPSLEGNATPYPSHVSSGFSATSSTEPPPAITPSSAVPPLSPLSTAEVGGKAVSLPPSYSQSSHATNTMPAAAQPSSLPSGADCVVCMDRPLEMVFVPCGHICVCEPCSSQITRCPICRTRTQMAVKVYYPY